VGSKLIQHQKAAAARSTGLRSCSLERRRRFAHALAQIQIRRLSAFKPNIETKEQWDDGASKKHEKNGRRTKYHQKVVPTGAQVAVGAYMEP